MRRLYDISPEVTPAIAVWPGDTPPRREMLLELARGDTVTLSTLRATVHLGAHADAPSHYVDDGETIEQRRIETYVGACQVIRADASPGTRLGPDVVRDGISAPRVLFATGTYPDPTEFRQDFAALSPELIEALASAGVILVGIDTPSVDPFDSKDLPAHRACHRHDVAILEGLVLDGVVPAVYELIALPLRLVGFDASPVRAILRET